ncbi:MAG TPA: hypothetical protein GXX46_06670 [Peptococcaceae bacterium]|nr:hypothetical protein [Peptococcaceae bacterium]
MPIDKVNLTSNLSQSFDSLQFKVGQRFLVEVLSKDQNQEGLIAVKGKLLRAKLEAQVQPGDLFWAVVKEADDEGIVLSRIDLNKVIIKNFSKEEILLFIKRGLAFDSEVYEYLKRIVEPSDLTIKNSLLALLSSKNKYLQKLVTLIWDNIPKWSQLSGKNVDHLHNYYQMLGIDYEYLIYQEYRGKQNGEIAGQKSLKYYLLQVLSQGTEGLTAAEKANLNNILSEITGQQLWMQTGNGENAYCLLHFPLQDQGQLYQAKLAIESSRYGRQIDKKHCHMALQVETPNMGLVGADLVFYNNKLSICILNDQIDDILPLIQKMEAEIHKGFAALGFQLLQITGKKFAEYPQFEKFIYGQQFSGVDLKG